MKTFIYKSFFIVLISFFIQTINGQNPNWAVNSAGYQYSMTFTAFLNVNGTTLSSTNDKVAAFINGEVRGVSDVVYVPSANKYVAYLSVFANTENEIINFKIYNNSSSSVINIDKTAKFLIDGNIGGIFQSYSIANPALNNDAVFSAFNFLGITSVIEEISSGKINITLPENTNITFLKTVFNSSLKSKVFVDGVKQESGVSINNFTNQITYQVLSENEANLKEYEVSVVTALNQNPTTVIISSTESLNTNTIPVALDVVFSKEVYGFEKSDFILENGVISLFSTSDSKTYKVEIIPLSQGAFSVKIPAGISLDENNNQNESSNKIELRYDVAKPIITGISVELDAGSWWFLTTFNEEVVNIDVTDFELTGMASNGLAISNITTVSANQYKINVSNSNTDIGAISLQLKNTSDIRDFSGNSIVLTEFEAYFLNNEVLSTDVFFNNSNLSLYPNPANDHIKIHLQEGKLKQIQLFNLNGKKVFEKNSKQQLSNQQVIIIDVYDLKSGVYFVKILSNKGSYIKRFIKILK